ncbi:MAG: hypothetical protein IJD91_05425 [Clostridia bacterium]|nr:hypothetical protein [Clostridia bacterium]
MKNKYDWEKLREEFSAADCTLCAFAKEKGMNYATLYHHYKKEGWEKKGTDIPSSPLEKEILIADKLTAVLDEAIDDKQQFYRYIVKEKNGSDSGEEERIFGKMDMQAFNNAIKALDALSEIKRVMHGILSPLEERKLSCENKNTESEKEENETGVVILPEVEDEK